MNLLTMLGLPLLACIVLAAILGHIGVHVIKREVIFIDIAVAQIAALGAIGGHLLFHLPDDTLSSLLCGIGATLLAALFFSVMHGRVRQLPIEALIGITYVVSAAAALFIIGKSSAGHTHTQKMLTGALLWITFDEVIWAAIVLGVVGLFFFLLRRPLQQLSDRYISGQKTRAGIGWDFLFYTLCGVVITIGVKLAGILVVFSFLIVPATISALFAKSWLIRTGIALLAGTVSAVAGLLLSYRFDFSAGASVTLVLILLLGIVSALQCALKRLNSGAGKIP